MLTRRHTLTAAVVMLCAALTGCEAADVGSAAPPPGSSLAPSGSPETGSPETGSPAASPSAAALPSASASASAAASAAAGNDLASTIPAEVNGIPITISTVEPEAFIGTNDRHRIQPLLTALGMAPADLEAVAGGGGSGTDSVIIEAVRIAGADPAALADQLRTVLSAVPGSSVEAGTVGGKAVFTLGDDRHVYVAGDDVYFVSASNPEMAEGTLTALP